MSHIDLLFWWVGACVCGAGALAAFSFVMWLPVNYAWRKLVDIHAFNRVCKEARRQGVPLFIGDKPRSVAGTEGGK